MIKIELFKSLIGKEKLNQNLSMLTKLAFNIEKQKNKVVKSNFGGFNSGDVDLNLMKTGQDLFDVTSSVLLGMRNVIQKYKYHNKKQTKITLLKITKITVLKKIKKYYK